MSTLIDAAVAAATPVHVLVRPRAGGFEYSASEVLVILGEATTALARSVLDLVALVDPSVIVVCGGVAQAWAQVLLVRWRAGG